MLKTLTSALFKRVGGSADRQLGNTQNWIYNTKIQHNGPRLCCIIHVAKLFIINE